MKRVSFVLVLLVTFCTNVSVAQNELYPYPFSVPNKSGFLPSSEAVNSQYRELNLTASYTNNLFIPQIGLSKIKLVYPSSKINTSVSLSFYGYGNYWNIVSKLGFSRHFKPYIAFGLTVFFSAYRFTLTDKNIFTGGADISLCVFPNKNICIGVSAENISFSIIKSGSLKYRLPVVFKVGLSFSLKKNVTLSIEGSKELKDPFLICSSIEYMPVKQFSLRIAASYQSNISVLLGFGLRLKGFFIDFDAFYNLGSGVGCRAAIGFYKLKKVASESEN